MQFLSSSEQLTRISKCLFFGLGGGFCLAFGFIWTWTWIWTRALHTYYILDSFAIIVK